MEIERIHYSVNPILSMNFLKLLLYFSQNTLSKEEMVADKRMPVQLQRRQQNLQVVSIRLMRRLAELDKETTLSFEGLRPDQSRIRVQKEKPFGRTKAITIQLDQLLIDPTPPILAARENVKCGG